MKYQTLEITQKFADLYNIQPIVKLCIDHLKSNITKDNFPEIMKASDLINDEGLLCAAVDFDSKNIGTFENDPDVKKFIRTNQDSFIKVFEEMMFKKWNKTDVEHYFMPHDQIEIYFIE